MASSEHLQKCKEFIAEIESMRYDAGSGKGLIVVASDGDDITGCCIGRSTDVVAMFVSLLQRAGVYAEMEAALKRYRNNNVESVEYAEEVQDLVTKKTENNDTETSTEVANLS